MKPMYAFAWVLLFAPFQCAYHWAGDVMTLPAAWILCIYGGALIAFTVATLCFDAVQIRVLDKTYSLSSARVRYLLIVFGLIGLSALLVGSRAVYQLGHHYT